MNRYAIMIGIIIVFFAQILWGDISLETFDYFSIPYNIENGVPYSDLRDVVQDRKGFLYFGSWGKGVFRYDGRQWVTYDSMNSGLMDDRIMEMAYNGKDHIYLSHTFSGVSSLDLNTGQVKVIMKAEGFSVASLAYYDGILYINSFWNGFHTYNENSGEIRFVQAANWKKGYSDPQWNTTAGMFKDSRGRLWGGTMKGAFLFDGREITRYFPGGNETKGNLVHIAELPGNRILFFYERYIGIVDEAQGLVKPWDNDYFNEVLQTQTLSSLHCFVIDIFGRYALSTYGGLFIYDPVEKRGFRMPFSISGDKRINNLFMDREKNLWITTQDGTSKVEPALFYNYHTIAGMNVYNANWNMLDHLRFEDNPDQRVILVFLKEERALELEGYTYREIPFSGLTPPGNYNTLHLEKPRKEILDAMGEVLPPGFRVGEYWVEGENRAWVATITPPGRLFSYENGVLKDQGALLPFKRMFINDIKTGKEGHLYLSTDTRGLFVIDPQTGKYEQYTKSEGLTGHHYFGGMALDRMGRVFMLSNEGLSLRNDYPPRKPVFNLHFYQVREIGGERSFPIPGTGRVDLPHGFRSITLFASANSFISEENLAYRFLPRWGKKIDRTFSGRNYVEFTALSPGTYKIDVEVRDNFGHTTESSLDFHIPPYWYENMVFRLFFLLFILIILVLLFWGLFAWKNQRLLKHSAEMEQMVEERTAQLKKTQQHLLETAHLAGKNEVARNFFHNIGNIANTISINAADTLEQMQQSGFTQLKKANALVRENIERLSEFFYEEKGQGLLRYYFKLEDIWQKEGILVRENQEKILRGVEEICLFITTQENYVKGGNIIEEIDLCAFIEDARKIFSPDPRVKGVTFKNYSNSPCNYLIQGHHSRVFHVLLGVYSFVLEELKSEPKERKLIETMLEKQEWGVKIIISYPGPGRSQEEIKRAFRPTYDTPPEYTYLSLHTCANFMAEMKGRLYVEKGDGKIIFILQWREGQKDLTSAG